MLRYALRRLLLVPLVLFGVSVVTFAVTRIIPGDPTDRLVGAAFLTDERRAEIRREYGLDRPYAAQFAAYLGGLARGDLGTSFLTSRPVAADLRQRFPATLELTAAAMLFAVVVAIPLGVGSAVWKGSGLDHLGRLLAVLGVSMPVFWSGLLLYLFFFWWQWAPPPIGRLEPAPSRSPSPNQLSQSTARKIMTPGDHRQRGSRAHVAPSPAPHVAPRRHRRLHAQAQEGHRRLQQDRERHAERRRHRDRGDRLRHHSAGPGSPASRTRSPARVEPLDDGDSEGASGATASGA
jgi:hypothetical protein